MAVETAIVEMTSGEGMKLIGAGLATLGMIGAGLGLGVMIGKFFEAIARQPSVQKTLFVPLMIGIGVIEAIAIFAFVIAVLIIFVA